MAEGVAVLRDQARWRLSALALWLLLLPGLVTVAPSHPGHHAVHEGSRSAAVVVPLPVGSLQLGAGLRPDPRLAAKTGGQYQFSAGECVAHLDARLGPSGLAISPAAPTVPRVVPVCSRGRSPPAN